jgi:hypothetical protein
MLALETIHHLESPYLFKYIYVMGDENILMVQYYNWQEKKNKKCLLAFSE